jgi:hypothetical protein
MNKFIAGITFFALPVVMFAQGPQLLNTETLITSVGYLIGLLIPIVAALALLYFFWGLAEFIRAQGNEEKKKEGKSIMTWGIVALFVMVSIWGIVNYIASDLGLVDTTPTAPTISLTVTGAL